MFLMSFVKGSKIRGEGSKSASGYGRGGPNPLADMDRGVHIRYPIWTGGSNSRGVQIR